MLCVVCVVHQYHSMNHQSVSIRFNQHFENIFSHLFSHIFSPCVGPCVDDLTWLSCGFTLCSLPLWPVLRRHPSCDGLARCTSHGSVLAQEHPAKICIKHHQTSSNKIKTSKTEAKKHLKIWQFKIFQRTPALSRLLILPVQNDQGESCHGHDISLWTAHWLSQSNQ